MLEVAANQFSFFGLSDFFTFDNCSANSWPVFANKLVHFLMQTCESVNLLATNQSQEGFWCSTFFLTDII